MSDDFKYAADQLETSMNSLRHLSREGFTGLPAPARMACQIAVSASINQLAWTVDQLLFVKRACEDAEV